MWVLSGAWHRGLRVWLSGLSLKLRPPICTVWNEEVLRMFAPWIYVRPGAYVYWPARRPGWLDEVKKGTKVEFCFPRQWNSNSYDLDPAVVLPVDGIQVAR